MPQRKQTKHLYATGNLCQNETKHLLAEVKVRWDEFSKSVSFFINTKIELCLHRTFLK